MDSRISRSYFYFKLQSGGCGWGLIQIAFIRAYKKYLSGFKLCEFTFEIEMI